MLLLGLQMVAADDRSELIFPLIMSFIPNKRKKSKTLKQRAPTRNVEFSPSPFVFYEK